MMTLLVKTTYVLAEAAPITHSILTIQALDVMTIPTDEIAPSQMMKA
jgi:hypothetical protein